MGRLEGAAAPYRYAGCVRRGVLRAKFQAAPWAADELGAEMARLLFGSEAKMRGFGPEVQPVPGLALSYDCIVPVPASSRARGYNVPERWPAPSSARWGSAGTERLLIRVHPPGGRRAFPR